MSEKRERHVIEKVANGIKSITKETTTMEKTEKFSIVGIMLLLVLLLFSLCVFIIKMNYSRFEEFVNRVSVAQTLMIQNNDLLRENLRTAEKTVEYLRENIKVTERNNILLEENQKIVLQNRKVVLEKIKEAEYSTSKNNNILRENKDSIISIKSYIKELSSIMERKRNEDKE